MGRPYRKELDSLPRTYDWARSVAAGPLFDAVEAIADLPLIAVGSGGSLSAAQYLADVHQRTSGRVSKTMTPLEVISLDAVPREAAVVVFSASGANRDIRAVTDALIEREPAVLILITCSPDNPASLAAKAAVFPFVVNLDLPSGRDGFLATNSLLAFLTSTYRSYQANGWIVEPLPESWTALTGKELPWKESLLRSETVIALHGFDSRAAAVDLESKCVESGLANVQLADFRNFAHGRHHWLAKHPDTSVVALVPPSDKILAGRTLRLLPKELSVTRVDLQHSGSLGGLEAFGSVFRLVAALGAAKGIDPGRPGVPEFGSKLYSLNAIKSANKRYAMKNTRFNLEPAVRRKARDSVDTLTARGRIDTWLIAHSRAIEVLQDSEFCALIFDYDGTILEKARQWIGPSQETSASLTRLLDGGIPIGVATGRGRSVGNDLRSSLPKRLWSRVLIGYYNGGSIASLSEDSQPNREQPTCAQLQGVLTKIYENQELVAGAMVTERASQITIEPKKRVRGSVIWELASSVVAAADIPGVRVVRSSHSIDILAPGISKNRLVASMKAKFNLPSELEILAVGDRGQWPGNDAELLSHLRALSVDECSADPLHAWNLFPAGVRGVQATLMLCRSIKITTRRTFRIDVETITSSKA